MTKRSVIITGASSGIGQALALEYARPGTNLLLCGRDLARLERIAILVREKGAEAEICDVPVTESERFDERLLAFDAQHATDILILAAGVKTGNVDGTEPQREMQRVLDVNLGAAFLNSQCLLPGMLARQSGQIVFFGSLAGSAPVGDLLSYSATKAGILAYGTALRRRLRGTGVRVSVCVPGFVDTPMSDRHLGQKPLMMSVDRAARRIRQGIDKGKARITFPLLLAFGVWALELLPTWLSDWVQKFFTAQILPDKDEAENE